MCGPKPPREDRSAAGVVDVPSPAPRHPLPEVEILHEFVERSQWSTFYRIGYRARRAGADWVAGEREFLDRGDAVALLPYCPGTGKILLTRQFRMPVWVRRPQEAELLEVCGGILDDADPEVTLRHEASEELGISLHAVEKVFEGYSTPGSVCEKVHYYLASYDAGQRHGAGGGLRQEGEDIEVVEMPLEEAMLQIRTAAIRDVRTIALVLYLALRLVQGPSAPAA